ncbi:MAG: hypothetical protein R3C44_24930 [Chloroflexota bacterium]
MTLFFLAFLPLFISPYTASPVIEMVAMSVVFMLITLIIFVLYGLLANGVRRQVVNSPGVVAWLQRSFAVAFVALGIRLALAER